MTAQLILYLDTSGEIHAELPGLNGARRKIELPDDLTTDPFLLSILHEEQRRQTKTIEDASAAHAKIEAERKARSANHNEEIARQHEAKWAEEYRNATPERQAEMKAKRDEIAKKIWENTSRTLGVPLANRVIPDKNRRPNRRYVTKDGGTYNPRTEKKFDINGKRVRQAVDRFKKLDTTGGTVIDIDF